jgi:hypothetical protein
MPTQGRRGTRLANLQVLTYGIQVLAHLFAGCLGIAAVKHGQ